MYHYIPYYAEHGGGILYRDPADIREEIGAIRTLLTSTAKRMQEAEEMKEELLLTMDGVHPLPHDSLMALAEVVEDCGSLKREFEELWERADGLASELGESLSLLQGGIA